jgi:hypothetical protein
MGSSDVKKLKKILGENQKLLKANGKKLDKLETRVRALDFSFGTNQQRL